MADRDEIAGFLRISAALVPNDPDKLPDAKQTLVNLARRSKSSAIRGDMVPPPGASGMVGPAYSSRIVEFTNGHWRPEVAETRSDSLRRCIAALRRLG